MARCKNEVVPGFLVIRFRDPQSEDTCRFVIQQMSLNRARIIHHSGDLLLWLVRVPARTTQGEIERLVRVRGANVHAVAPLTLRPPVPRVAGSRSRGLSARKLRAK